MADSSSAEPLEGFHEVSLSSPTTPDLQNQAEQRAPLSSLFRTAPPAGGRGTKKAAPAGGAALRARRAGPHSALRADQLPTQPVYSTPRPSHNGSVPGLEVEPADGNFPSAEEGEEPELDVVDGSQSGRQTDSQTERLKEELAKAQRALLLKEQQCDRLSEVRDRLSDELEELTASLFEEAHKMVREANIKQATAEKQLKEALDKIDVLQAEVQALKSLVLSSPSSPVSELPAAGVAATRSPFRKGHGRNKSTSSAMLGSQSEAAQSDARDCREVDGLLFSEFKLWLEDPTLDRSDSFLDRIYREDIHPCLTFSRSTLGSAILEAVEQNALSVEPVGFQPLPVVKASAVECGGPKKCALCAQTKTCRHRIKFGDSSSYYYVSPYCRYRITSVCNFFTYIRYIHQGLVKQQDAEQMFLEVVTLRREMSLAKLGFYKDQL